MGRTKVRMFTAGAFALVALGVAALLTPHAAKAGGTIGINLVLRCDPTAAVLADLGRFGAVLDVMPEIRGATLRADESALAAIQALPYVAAANPDREGSACVRVDGASVSDFSGGASEWNLDAINVTDAGAGRTVAYDGTGVYVAVIDTGLPTNWHAYFPEERIATQLARAFAGGGGNRGAISESGDWEHDTNGHGAMVTSIVIGFHYAGPASLPSAFNGVAPKATVIPVRVLNSNHAASAWSSVVARGVLYVADLKASGALGYAPAVINLSLGFEDADVLLTAAIDLAISHGVVVVASAGNNGAAGMLFPGRYAPVISAGATGWSRQFPADDPTEIAWLLRDVPEGSASEHYVAPFSSVELAGQDLDVVAPGFFVPAPWSNNGQADYSFVAGTSAAAPHVAGVAALLLQKNPGLAQAEVEDTLENTALPLAFGSVDVRLAGVGPGNGPTWGDHDNVFYYDATLSWGADATGHGLVQAEAALAATPAH